MIDPETKAIIHHKAKLRMNMNDIYQDFKSMENQINKGLMLEGKAMDIFLSAIQTFRDNSKRLVAMGETECYLAVFHKKCSRTKYFKCDVCLGL